jgi:hypothetical protein
MASEVQRKQGRKSLSGKAKITAKLGIEFDLRPRLQVVRDLRGQGVDASLAIRPKGFVELGGLHQEGAELLLPLGGISGKTTVLYNESGEYSIYPADRYGFNNPDSEWSSPQTLPYSTIKRTASIFYSFVY